MLAARGLSATVAASSTVSAAMSGGSSSGLSATVEVVSGSSGTMLNPLEPDPADEFAPPLELPTSPPVVTVGRSLVSVATSLPAPTLVDGRPT
jgi:hypothetical protein